MSLSGLTPQSYLLGTLLSAASLKAGEFFASQEKSWRGHVVVFGILGIGGVLAAPLSRSLSKWTGTVLTHTQSLLIFGVAATLKAMSLASARFLFLKEVTGYEEVRSLYEIQLRPLHVHFKAHPDKFSALDLHTQTILNKRFSEQKFEPIPIQAFTEIGTDYTQEELDHLASTLDLSKVPSQEDRQKVVLFLYDNNLPLIKLVAKEDYDLLSITDLTEKEISELSPERLQWIWGLLANKRLTEIDSKLFQALAQAFFSAKLPPPINPIFFLNLEDHLHPSSYDPIPQNEQYLIPWLKNYYHHRNDKWVLLPLRTQMLLNRFFKTNHTLSPRESDFHWIQPLIPSFHKLYKKEPKLWHALPTSVQLKFNEAFKSASLETIEGLQTLSKEQFEEVLTMFLERPYLFDNLTETQQREVCRRALDLDLKLGWNSNGTRYERHLLHVKPFSKTMNVILDEKEAKTMRCLTRVSIPAFTVLFVGGIWSYCYLLMMEYQKMMLEEPAY